jgi:hypothetical protein
MTAPATHPGKPAPSSRRGRTAGHIFPSPRCPTVITTRTADEFLGCGMRAHERAEETDNLDVVAMAGARMDRLIEKSERRNDG